MGEEIDPAPTSFQGVVQSDKVYPEHPSDLKVLVVLPWKLPATVNRTPFPLRLVICEGSQTQHEADSSYI